jgi:hypothetical protein
MDHHVGRNAEIGLLGEMVAKACAGQGAAAAVYGAPGIGKSALLAEVARAAPENLLVMRVTGIEADAELPFAALHLLLRPMRHLVDRLPSAQRAALLGAFGEGKGEAPDRFHVGLAVLTVLAEERALLCLVDDVQWLDRASADALVFAARRLAAERVLMIFAGRDGAELILHGIPDLRLSGLDKTECERLLHEHAPDLTPQARTA